MYLIQNVFDNIYLNDKEKRASSNVVSFARKFTLSSSLSSIWLLYMMPEYIILCDKYRRRRKKKRREIDIKKIIDAST